MKIRYFLRGEGRGAGMVTIINTLILKEKISLLAWLLSFIKKYLCKIGYLVGL